MKDFNRPIIEGDSINFDNIFYFVKHIVQNYFKFAIFLLPLFFLYKLTQTPNYSSSISFYSNYEKSNQIPSSLGFIQAISSPTVFTFHPSKPSGGIIIAKFVFPQALGNAAPT